MRSMQCNVDYGYRFSIYFSTEENHGNGIEHWWNDADILPMSGIEPVSDRLGYGCHCCQLSASPR